MALSPRRWTSFILFLFFTISWGYTYENDTISQMFGAQLAARANSRLVAPDNEVYQIVVIGDLHGDHEHALSALKLWGVVNERGDWSGNVKILVQMGDIMDR